MDRLKSCGAPASAEGRQVSVQPGPPRMRLPPRNEIGVAPGHFAADAFPPRDQPPVKLLRQVRPFRREVAGFADVIPEVVEFETAVFEELDQLVVAAAPWKADEFLDTAP